MNILEFEPYLQHRAFIWRDCLVHDAPIEYKSLQWWELGLDGLKNSLIRQPLVLVSFLLRDFEPTLEIRLECLHFVRTPRPCNIKTVVKGIFERNVVSGSGSEGVEVCEIGDTMSWSAVRFFVLRLSCCLEVRGWRTSCHKVTSRNFLLSLRALYDMYKKDETSYTILLPLYVLYILYTKVVYMVQHIPIYCHMYGLFHIEKRKNISLTVKSPTVSYTGFL